MYEVAARLDPDRYLRLARAVFAEMALAGITAVGEFHYVHHAPGGDPYTDPNIMGEALIEAASQAGIRITLLDTCYLAGGFDEPLSDHQLRFGDGDADSWAARVETIKPRANLIAGAAIHSVRAVPEKAMEVVATWARDHEVPLHFHLSEQPGENKAAIAATGLSPTQLLHRADALGPRSTAVHATHLTGADVATLGASQTSVCLCPTTERFLADGVGPAHALVSRGCRLCLGTDSHAGIDMSEEARAVELDERLVTHERGHHDPHGLFQAMTSSGMSSLGWDAGALAPGMLCDLVALDIDSPRLAGYDDSLAEAHVVFAASAADVTDVVVSGRHVVRDRSHTLLEDVGAELRAAIAEVLE
jgi:formiminoglutamate deiminase